MTWRRLNIVVEGQTEESFAAGLLEPHLRSFAIHVKARMVAKTSGRARRDKGGMVSYGQLRRDLTIWMKEDRSSETRFTTMVDLYRYPKNSPGFESSVGAPPRSRVAELERAMALDIGDSRLIPHIQLHEFETLLFSDLAVWRRYFIGRQAQVAALSKAISTYPDIELINDGAATAPSKRILGHLPEYDKVAAGTVLADAIGLTTIRQRCSHFDAWLSRLETI